MMSICYQRKRLRGPLVTSSLLVRTYYMTKRSKKNPQAITVESIMHALKDRVTYKVYCEEEHLPYVGNCSAIDEDTDRSNEKWIADQLEAGNDWAWCSVRVSASFRGVVGVDHLGGCSYLSEEDFCTPGGYWDDLKNGALRNLAEQLLEVHATMIEIGVLTT